MKRRMIEKKKPVQMLNHRLNKYSQDLEEMLSIHRYFVHLIILMLSELKEFEEKNIDVGLHEVYQHSTITIKLLQKQRNISYIPVVPVLIVDQLYLHLDKVHLLKNSLNLVVHDDMAHRIH